MTRTELAIKALTELPEDRREELADLILDIVANDAGSAMESVLTQEQLTEVRRRREEPFEAADEDYFDKLMARLS